MIVDVGMLFINSLKLKFRYFNEQTPLGVACRGASSYNSYTVNYWAKEHD